MASQSQRFHARLDCGAATACDAGSPGFDAYLGAAGGFLETSTRPSNQEAYELYLRSVAASHDTAPNREAIKILERAVELDPNYAPAWAEVGQRYYYDATYSNGGELMFQHSNAALERALALDPNLIAAASQLIVNRVDRGELGKAYEEATALVKRRPESARPFHSQLCSALCGNAGGVCATMRYRRHLGSGKLPVPFLRLGLYGVGPL